MLLRAVILAVIAVSGFDAFGVGWFELSSLADIQSLVLRETLKVQMARAAQ
jgi:hypothetical protein